MKIEKRDVLIGFLLLILFLVTRMLSLFFSPYLFVGEECTRGTIAINLLNNPRLSVFQFQKILSPYEGGVAFVISFIKIYFKMFGVSGLSLKLVGLSISAVLFSITYLFSFKHFNKKVALLTSLFFILSPPFYITRTLTPMGDFLEASLFSLIIAFLFYTLIIDNRMSVKGYILFALICAVAVWMNYGTILMIINCLIFWYVIDRKFFIKKQFLIFILFIFIGFILFFLFNYKFDSSFFKDVFGLSGRTNRIFNLQFSNQMTKLYYLFFHDWPLSFGFRDIFLIKGRYLNLIFYLLFLLAFLFLIKKYFLTSRNLSRKINIKNNKKLKVLFILSFFLLFVVFYTFTDFEIEHKINDGDRYLALLYPFLFLLLAIFVTKIDIPLLRTLVLGFVLLFGAISFLSILGLEVVNYQSSCPQYFIWDAPDYITQNITLALDSCELFPKEQLPYCVESICWEMASISNFGMDSLLRQISSLNNMKLLNSCYEGIATRIAKTLRSNISKFSELCDTWEETYRSFCYVGLGKYRWRDLEEAPLSATHPGINDKYLKEYYEGLGWSIAFRYLHSQKRFNEVINGLDTENRKYAYIGVGRIAYLNNLSCSSFDSSFRDYCIQGIEKEQKGRVP